MEAIRKIKNELGITDSQLAIYLGVSRSFLSMVQKGERNLSSNANLLVTRLLLSMQQILPVAPATIVNKNQLNSKLLRAIRDTDIKIRRLQKELLLMKEQYSQTENLKQAAVYLLQNPLAGKEAAREQLWLNAQLDRAKNRQKKSNGDKQKLVQIQLEILLYTSERLKDFKQSLI